MKKKKPSIKRCLNKIHRTEDTIRVLTEVRGILADLLNGIDEDRRARASGHNGDKYIIKPYEKAEEWLSDHDFT